MTPKERAAMQQALEALEEWKSEYSCNDDDEAIAALRESLAEQAEQDPVAWMDLHKELGQLRWAGKDICWDLAIDAVRNRLEELSAAPVRTKDLTDEEIEDAVGWTMTEQSILDCRAVITADREKNK